MRAPPARGSVTIAGATAARATLVNGNFERTAEMCNGKPVYRKKGDPSTWLEAVNTRAGTWRWYVKPTSARGPDSSVCFGYGTCETLKDPHECDAWYVYDESDFVIEPDVICELEPGGEDTSTTDVMEVDDIDGTERDGDRGRDGGCDDQDGGGSRNENSDGDGRYSDY